MRTRIKWLALTLAVIAGTTLTTVSCSSDSTAPSDPSAGTSAARTESPSLLEKLAWMGEYHNKALSYAFAAIKQSGSASTFGKCKAGLAALKEFQLAFRRSGGSAVFEDLTLTDGMCEAAEASQGISRSVDLSGGDLRPRNDISESAVSYMDRITTAVDTMTSVPGLTTAVRKIANSAGTTLVALEADAVAGTGSIAVSSADYWTTTGATSTDGSGAAYSVSLPRTLSGDLSIAPPSAPRYAVSPRARAIIKADISAAISVLLYDWWMGDVALGKAAIKAAAASMIAGLYAT
jgi:hypothetical protein